HAPDPERLAGRCYPLRHTTGLYLSTLHRLAVLLRSRKLPLEPGSYALAGPVLPANERHRDWYPGPRPAALATRARLVCHRPAPALAARGQHHHLRLRCRLGRDALGAVWPGGHRRPGRRDVRIYASWPKLFLLRRPLEILALGGPERLVWQWLQTANPLVG